MADLDRLFEAHLPVDPPIGEEVLSQIPAKRGVALLAAASDRPIVLLPGADLRSRIRNRLAAPTEEERKKTPDLHEVTRSVRWILAESHFETDLAYMELARWIWPARFRQMLAFKPPWFVHVDPDEAMPAFRRGRDVLPRPGICVGPFPSARTADRFIGILEDVFQLCRDPGCLAQAPEAETCTYGQMGRCLRPCDGTIDMEAYRRVVARAGQFAAGQRGPVQQELADRMRQAAAALEFEQAAQLKSRLERISELDDPVFAHVRAREQLAYLSVQRSAKAHTVNVLLVWAGRVASAGRIPYPPGLDVIDPLLAQMRQMVRQAGTWPLAERLRMGLAAQMLLASPRRGGLWLDWTEKLTADEVRAAIVAGADELKVTPPPEPKNKPSATGPGGADRLDRDPPAGSN